MPRVGFPISAQPLWLPTENLAAGPWEPVCAPVRLASAAASVSFASIPAQYVMFRLRCEIINDASAKTIDLRLNNDSGVNYDTQQINVSNVTVTGGRSTGRTSMYVNYSNLAASELGTVDFVIAKPIAGAAGLILASVVNTTTAALDLVLDACIWNNTAALINRIDVVAAAAAGTGNFAAGSIFILEGSKS